MSSLPSVIHFFERPFPSANVVLIKTERPVVIDTGYGSDIDETLGLIRREGVDPASLTFAINTHYHSDHVGGNHRLQTEYGVPVAAHETEAATINERNADACAARWLDQPVEAYRVDEVLRDGDEVDAGEVTLRVVATPGHTRGHLSVYVPEFKILICGDAVHSDDVCWINSFLEGADALERTIDSIDRLSQFDVRWFCSGHGPATDDPGAAFDRARKRLAGWRTAPERMAWHAMKRIFVYQLMIRNGMAREDVTAYLLRTPWYSDYVTGCMDADPGQFVQVFLEELDRSGAARWEGDRLLPAMAYTKPDPEWTQLRTDPGDWP